MKIKKEHCLFKNQSYTNKKNGVKRLQNRCKLIDRCKRDFLTIVLRIKASPKPNFKHDPIRISKTFISGKSKQSLF